MLIRTGMRYKRDRGYLHSPGAMRLQLRVEFLINVLEEL